MTINDNNKKSVLEEFEYFVRNYGFLEFTTVDMEWGKTKKVTLDLDQFRESVLGIGK